MPFLKEISEQRDGLKRGKKTLRQFGFLLGTVLLAFSVLTLIQGRPGWRVALPPAVLFFAAAAVRPGLLWPLYKPWMTLSFVLGYFVSRLVLSIIYYFVMTPVALVLRLTGKDLLQMKKRNSGTYWIPRKKKPADTAQYGRMY
jgi:hypothetical protein